MKRKILGSACLLTLIYYVFFFQVQVVEADLEMVESLESRTELRGTGGVALFSGQASYSYPIEVPPGTNGLQPAVGLSYGSHGSKDHTSIVGAGWSLGNAYIEVDAQYKPHEPQNFTYLLNLNGSDDLIYNTTAGYYQTKVNHYNKIEKKTGSTSNDKDEYWLVTTKDGTQYRFGYNADSERVCNGASVDYVYRWYLDAVTDIHGNNITYSYQESSDNSATYPQTISYNTDNTRTVEFTLADKPSGTYNTQYHHGCKNTYSKRVTDITTKLNSNQVKQYSFTYDDTFGVASKLSSITEKGANDTALPTTDFTYNKDLHANNETWDETNSNVWFRSDTTSTNENDHPVKANLNNPDITISDVNGDGLLDMVNSKHVSGNQVHWQVVLNQGNQLSGSPSSWMNNGDIADRQFSSGETQLIDVSGDALPDIVTTVENGGNYDWYVALNNGSSWQHQSSPWLNSSLHLGDKNVTLRDVNGDNIADIVESDKDGNTISWHVQFGTGSDWNSGTRTFLSFTDSDPNYNSDLYLENTQTGIMDMNGDGLADLVNSRSESGYVIYRVYRNTGKTWDETPVVWLNYNGSAVNIIPFGSHSTTLSDINSDGLPDLVYSESLPNDYNWKVFYNQGDQFSATDTSIFFATKTQFDIGDLTTAKIKLADLDGNGVADIIKSDFNSIESGKFIWKVWDNVFEAPHRLETIDTAAGGTVDYEYIKSNPHGTNSQLPFTLWLVEKEISDNGLTNNHANTQTKTFAYAGGKYNWDNHESRGFAEVSQIDSDGNQTIHYYRQDDTLKGREYKTELLDDADLPYQILEQGWSAYHEGNQIYSPRLIQQKTSVHDGDTLNPFVTQVDYTYDSFGNVTEAEYQGDTSITGDERFTYTEYTTNQTAWILSTPKHSYTHAADDTTKVQEAWFYYDNNVNVDDQPLKGLVTKQVVWNDAGTDLETTYEYDSYGNQTKVTNPRGHATQTIYGLTDTTRTVPEKTINAKSQETLYSYDLANGNLLSTTDPNGYVTSYEYDTFGRKTAEIKPYDSSAFPTMSFTYNHDGVAPESIVTASRKVAGQAGTLNTYAYVDGLGQTIQTKSPAEDGNWITSDTFFNADGQSYKTSNPYFSVSSGYSDADTNVSALTNSYDAIDRVIQTIHPDASVTSSTFDKDSSSFTDANGHTQTSTVNGYGQIAQIVERNKGTSYTTTYTYDEQDNLLSITDHLSNVISFEYDSLGRQTKEIDPNRGTWTRTYDANGNLVTETDNRSITTTYTYDQLDRVSGIDYPNDTDVTYTYDSSIIGTLSGIIDALGITTFGYDNRLRLTSETKNFDTYSWTTSLTYDSMDRVTSRTYPDSEVVNYTFNGQGEIETASSVLSDIDYNQFGKIASRTAANTLATNYTYDTDSSRLTNITTGSLQDNGYYYDKVGNVTYIQDQIQQTLFTYQYDDLDRLTIAQKQGTGGYLHEYIYDAIGNLLSFNDNQNLHSYTYSNPKSQQVTQVSTSSAPPIEGIVSWFNPDWDHRKRITLDSNDISGSLTDFPVLLEDIDSDLIGQVQTNGEDFLITASDGVTKLAHEVTNFDGVTGTYTIWFKAPALNSSGDNIFYLYFGNDQATDQQDAENVWRSEYKAVWHMDESSGTRYDSTANNNDLTDHNTVTSQAGVVNNQAEFDNNNSEYLKGPNNGSLDLDTDVSISAWVDLDQLPGNNNYVFLDKRANDGSNYGWMLWLKGWNKNRLAFVLNTSSGEYSLEGPTDSASTNLQHVTATWSNQTDGKMRLYVDGQLLVDGGTHTQPIVQTSGNAMIGALSASSPSNFFDGTIDEQRVYEGELSADWVVTEYNNLSDSEGFRSIGALEDVPPVTGYAPCPLNEFLVEYFDNKNLAGSPVDTACATSINHDFGTGSPIAGVSSDNFSIKWSGDFDFTADDYTFTTTADDGVRVKVDDVTLIDGWVDQTATTYSANTTLTQGSHNIVVEYYDHLNTASINASWQAYVPPAWYDSAWDHRKLITIDENEISGTVSDFPVLVSLTDSELIGNVQADGDDLLITANDGTTKLAHELTEVNSSTGEVSLWFKAPALNSSGTNSFYLYFGNDTASNQEDVANVWRSEYKAVWHLDETSGIRYDSTANNNDLTDHNSVTSETGVINDEARFVDTNSEHLKGPNNGSLDLVNNLSISTWVDPDVIPGNTNFTFIDKRDNSGANYGWLLWMKGWAKKQLSFVINTSSGEYSVAGPTNSATANLQQVTATWSNQGDGKMRLYVDGQLFQEGPVNTNSILQTNGNAMIGALSASSPSNFFDGTIDEQRIYDGELSADWISTEYNNQNAPATFVSLGQIENN